MGTYPSFCKICNKSFMWFSGLPVQVCVSCNTKINTREEKIEKEENLIKDVSKFQKQENLRNRLKDLKNAHKLFKVLIKELENEIEKEKS